MVAAVGVLARSSHLLYNAETNFRIKLRACTRRMAVAHSAPVNPTCPMDGRQKKNESQCACGGAPRDNDMDHMEAHMRSSKKGADQHKSPTNENEK